MTRQLPPAPAAKPAWMREAPCNDASPDLFFPLIGEAGREAKTWCNGGGPADRPACPFRSECLAYALDNREPAGVWGGFSTVERRRMLRTGHVPPFPGPVPPLAAQAPRPPRRHRTERATPTLAEQVAAVPDTVAARVRGQYARGVKLVDVAAWNSLTVAVARRLTRGVPRGLTGEGVAA